MSNLFILWIILNVDDKVPKDDDKFPKADDKLPGVKDKPKVNPIPDKIAGSGIFHCKTCNLLAKDKVDLVNQKVSDHNWCTQCFSTFNSEENLKIHTATTHKKKKQSKKWLDSKTKGESPKLL